MRKMIYLLLIFCLVLATTIGCNNKSDSGFSKVERQDIPKEVRNFIDRTSEENGIYLYSNNIIDDYLFLNAINVKKGEKAAFFTDVKFEIEEHTLKISFNEKLTADDSNYAQKIDNMLIYKIKLSKEFDTIIVFKNGEAVPLDAVGT